MRTWTLATILLALAGLAGFAQGAAPDAKDSAAPAAVAPAPTLSLDLGGGMTLDAVLIPAGEFVMGLPEVNSKRRINGDSPSTTPHTVTITRAFYLGKYEVTQELYEKIMGKNPSACKHPPQPPTTLPKGSPEAKAAEKAAREAAAKDPTEFPKNPVEMVSPKDAQAFCEKVSQLTGKKVRLPTEAEWEYAARAGSHEPPATASFTKAFLDEVAIMQEPTPRAVGQKKPNPWGLYDMYGNVAEWVQDFSSHYEPGPVVDPQGPDEAASLSLEGGKKGHIVRGGWYSWKTADNRINVACSRMGHTNPHAYEGFRVVVEVPKAL